MTDENNSLTVQEQPRQRAQIVAGGQVGALVPQTLEEAYRLADAMSRSGMTPNSIKTPEAVLVAIMAGAELGMAPFQSLQSFAVINGKPGLWGDAVPALLWSHGFDLDETFEGEDTSYPDTMKAVCTVTRPNGKQITRSFSVFDAKEGQLWTKSGPWQTARKRMLQMRARAFAARDGAPDVLRGLHIAEEVQDFTPIGSEMLTTGTGMVERLKQNAATVDSAGFNVRQIAETTEAAKPKRQYRKKGSGNEMLDAIAEVEPELVAQVIEDHANDSENATRILDGLNDVLEGDVIPQHVTGGAQTAEPEPDLSDSATDAVLALAAETFGATASDEPSQSGEPLSDGKDPSNGTAKSYMADSEPDDRLPEGKSFNVLKRNAGPAPAGEVYILSRAVPGYDGKVATFKDGKPFSTVGAKGALLLMTFDDHPQAPEMAAEPVREVAAPEVAKEDASPFEPFWEALQGAIHWTDAKDVIRALYRMPEFTALALADKAELRAQVWLEIDASDNINVDMADDPTAFRLWLDTQEGRDGADAIEGNFRVLKAGAPFKAMNGDNQDALEDVVQATTARLRS